MVLSVVMSMHACVYGYMVMSMPLHKASTALTLHAQIHIKTYGNALVHRCINVTSNTFISCCVVIWCAYTKQVPH